LALLKSLIFHCFLSLSYIAKKLCLFFGEEGLSEQQLWTPFFLQVRFTEPVVITACEVVELQQQSLCPSISLTG